MKAVNVQKTKPTVLGLWFIRISGKSAENPPNHWTRRIRRKNIRPAENPPKNWVSRPQCRKNSAEGSSQHQYADDTQLHIAISVSSAAANLKVLESALSSLSFWFLQNCLALNPEKSDAILLVTEKRNLELSGINAINVAGSTVPLALLFIFYQTPWCHFW